MKQPGFLAVSLIGNLVLVAAFLVVRHGSTPGTAAPALAPAPAPIPKIVPALPVAKGTPVPVVPWRLIASADYRQYVANLRAVGCPEWLVRDIIVADIDDLYNQKSRTDPVYFAPWQGADQRREATRTRSAKLNALRQEKRTLVKSLLGYEWENYGEEVWDQDLATSLTMGFMPDDKAVQVLSLKDQYAHAAQDVREDANFILIDDDRARLQSLYDGFESDLSQLLDPSQLDELQLRAQQSFLTANDIHFDGVTISDGELRELVRMSKGFRDIARSDFVPDHPVSDTDEAGRNAAFETQVKSLLGSERFAGYQRAQDPNFREIFAFSQQNSLPPSAAVKVYESRQNASEQADEIQKDGSLSPGERAAALVVLKAATMNTISSALGGSYQDYLQGPGQWLGALTPSPEMQTTNQTQ
jgi:hypothetical protein